MASAQDVAVYILEKCGTMTAMKLQKLAYYSQAWHLTWDEKPLFSDAVQAWANGPVVYSLYECHRGSFDVDATMFPDGNPSRLAENQTASIDAVLDYYGGYSAHQLSEITHHETPWRDARVGLGAMERGSNEISPASMIEFYSGLVAE